MRYSDWEPTYEEILADFGFDRAKDEEAARIAADIISGNGNKCEAAEAEIERLIRGKEVIICGNAPCLENDIKEKDIFTASRVVIAADGATSILLRNAIIPDIIVTDLDGNIADIIYANRLGAIIVAHAHGDNIEMLIKVLPALNANVICTTQSRPLHNVYNFGGFTDGDRCVFLAKEFGAKEIELVGFDFEDKDVSARKKKKLKWAKRLIRDVL
ncbi:6-hydroxymethyl-7,8-dihydropterin pyrophosphokinase [ANME-1 cluster archaeon GoMg2]|nr:6-hydroxymethyl-7,8-dihydropterin pyrophosphokinase [ANME-1 cluster archaeon GoMg2]